MVKQSNKIAKLVCIRDKYNITIPQKIREIIDLNIGDHIQFTWDGNGGISINKVIPYLVRLKGEAEKKDGDIKSFSLPKNNGENKECVEQ